LIVENIHDGIITVDLENRIIDMNPAAEELTGYETQEVLGHQPEFFGGGGAGEESALREAIADGMEREGRYFGEVLVHRKDGTQRVSELIVVPLRDARGEVLGAVGVNRDITERKQAEGKLRETIDQLRETDRKRRQLLSRLISAQEEERLRIAGEIHDDPVQQLFAASIRLGMLKEHLTDPKHLEIHSKAETLVDTTISRLRRMLFELQPRSLETDGLAAALSEYLAYANNEGETRFTLEDRLTNEQSQDMRTVAYRVVLESLSNVRKHAAATTVTVMIEDHEDGIRCRVTDDGRGFMTVDMAEYQPGHLGVPAMRERVELAGGRFEITSSPGEGTTVEFWLPAA
jgi:PAS domain S-box-containing protein